MPDKTMKSTASNAGDNVFISFDLSFKKRLRPTFVEEYAIKK